MGDARGELAITCMKEISRGFVERGKVVIDLFGGINATWTYKKGTICFFSYAMTIKGMKVLEMMLEWGVDPSINVRSTLVTLFYHKKDVKEKLHRLLLAKIQLEEYGPDVAPYGYDDPETAIMLIQGGAKIPKGIPPLEQINLCTHCRAEGPMWLCGCCRLVGYCNVTCQKADWWRHKPQKCF